MATSKTKKPATLDLVSNDGFQKVFGETGKTKSSSFTQPNQISLDYQAARFIQRRFALPFATARTIAGLAGLGGLQ